MIDFNTIFVETTVNVRYIDLNKEDETESEISVHIKAKVTNYNPPDLFERYNNLFICDSIHTPSDICYYLADNIVDLYHINEVTISYFENNNKYSYEYFERDEL